MTTPTTPEPLFLATNFALIASRLLDLAVEHLGEHAPDRTYLSAGVPAWDFGTCGQLVLWAGPATPGYPGAGTGGRPDATPNIGRTYQLVLELARCVPTLEDDGAPPAIDLNDAGKQAFIDFRLLDVFLLHKVGVNSKIRDAMLQACGLLEVAPVSVAAVNPQGGMSAVRLTFTAVL